MGMSDAQISTIKRLMEYEAARTEPPVDFPNLPDIPAGRYIDQRFFELEKEHLWRKSWLFAAHIDEIPDPGCYMLWENAGQPIIIVHGDDDQVYAYYNTCRHRGAPVVTDSKGKKARLTCKYHGWTYTHQGELVSVRDPEDFRDLDFSCRGLIPVRCERFGNLIFVNFDEHCISLREYLGPIVDEWEEFQFDKIRLSARHSFVLDCNWKIAMEANTEVYHVKSIHPSTVAPALDDRRNVNTFYNHGHGRMIAPRPKGGNMQSAIELPDLPEIETVGELGRTCTQSYGIFPNWVSPLSHRAVPPLLFWPLSIDKTLFEVWTMAPDWGDGEGPDYWTENNGEQLNQVLREDTEFGVWIQKSMESYGFRGVPLSYQEARIYHWNQQADRIIGIDNIPEELRVAQVIGEDWMYPNDPRVAYA
ncbi:MAG: aromatic ring-hydroxylating dioxygenase subunit alpha [Pseudomonadales bacterium]|nr:aromatic ring-hydroxylating dioxygenase subunit alpha [Pseudomonadales bacterium]MBO6563710.1 aromatic ring-hydroxylating dioxygenase subunit alpha [Pseudomonadales bacterium]MBO6596768.1 aromatic ring-hydroxylating dioxygenase subunit alpha [Pseudomonadales bacterium]MBO6656070.1 aromatic ring-hydroxylating dioxygenase subunit alpha [Pseudomonadales bacterium]MBO6823243.1 aromatic ring-hydroxylating dioxygenase subunit alpha [Pseudomonadales bacterium]